MRPLPSITPPSSAVPETFRQHLERTLLADFPAVRPVDRSLIPALARFADGNFGHSLLSLLLYCNGRNPGAQSRAFPDGLCFCHRDALFGIGAFVTDGGGGGVHLVAPRGPAGIAEATRVAALLHCRWPSVRVYARHLSPALYEAMRATGRWSGIDANPWVPSAPQEDETWPHRRLVLADLIESATDGAPVRMLTGPGNQGFRRKSRLTDNRFKNFLARSGATYVLRPHTAETVPLVLNLIAEHFADLRRAGKPVVGSSHHDYAGLASLVPETGDPCRCLLGFLEGPGWRQAVSFFAVEALGRATVGGYATITRRNPAVLPVGVDPRGFSAITSGALIALARQLSAEGCQVLDLGGSEGEALDHFKRQLGARPAPTVWAIFRGSPR
jgi:hypothetical protein